MNKRATLGLALLLAVQAGWPAARADAAQDSRMTQYRVYQNDKALREFPREAQAVAYAQRYAYSHVERIADRAWVWDNFPRYRVYQNGVSDEKWAYRTYAEALSKARTLTNVHIRDLEKPGWVYSRHERYRLYQGDKTLAAWGFATLAEAKREARKWGNAHIMDLATNEWIWDNLTAAQKDAARAGEPVYALSVDGTYNTDDSYPFLLDAIRASAKMPGSEVVNMKTGVIVHSNIPSYTVRQNGKDARRFFGLDNAVTYAKTLAGAEIVRDGQIWWTNIPYLQVFQGDRLIRYFHTKQGAIDYARSYANARIVTADGRPIWNNLRKLVYVGWNGSSNTSTVLNHVSATQGLDIDSPTWFELEKADGTLTDNSDPAVVAKLKAKGMRVMPLVHNQFDAKLTTAFLQNAKAQSAFISELVERLAELGADGVNLDFESLAGSDRDRYTAFVRDLAKAVHDKGMTISIDLPRGDTAWNHLTAYDHAKLGEYVDTVIIMAYDQFWRGSTSPGSVSGLEWAEQGVVDFLSYGIPRSKLMLGVPFYIREWKLDASGKLVDSRAVLMKDLPALIEQTNPTSAYDEQFGQTKYTYVKDGYTYVLWAETPETVKARIDIAKKYDLAGVAAWRLGYESPELWTMMLQQK